MTSLISPQVIMEMENFLTCRSLFSCIRHSISNSSPSCPPPAKPAFTTPGEPKPFPMVTLTLDTALLSLFPLPVSFFRTTQKPMISVMPRLQGGVAPPVSSCARTHLLAPVRNPRRRLYESSLFWADPFSYPQDLPPPQHPTPPPPPPPHPPPPHDEAFSNPTKAIPVCNRLPQCSTDGSVSNEIPPG